MQPKFSVPFIKPTTSVIRKMIKVVVLALSLVGTTIALPVTPEEQVAPQTYTVPLTQQAEKTGVQDQSEVYTPPEQAVQQYAPVTKVENVPVDVENTPISHTENPVLLPIQPVSVVPVNPVGQVLRPVIVPAEAIAAGRVIIMAIEPTEQRSFQDAVDIPQKLPNPQIVQPVIYTPVQTQGVEPNQQHYYVKPTEKQTPIQEGVQQTEQIQPNQAPLIREQAVPVKQTAENYFQEPQVYNVQQNLQQVTESVEKGQHQAPFHTPYVEQTAQQHQIQKVLPQQAYPVQSQQQEYQQIYNSRPFVAETVEKQVYNAQQTVPQEGQIRTYTPVQNQPVEQVYNTQPVQQVYNPQHVEEPVHNVGPAEQVYNVQPVEQVYNAQPVQEKYVETQYVEPQQQQAEPIHHHVYNAAVGQTENAVPYQTAAQVPHKTVGVEPHRVQNQQFENYAAQPPYNYGEKLPQTQQNYPEESSGVVSVHA